MKKLLQTILLILISGYSFAQVTTSNISGTIVDASKKAIEGATITVIHQPSGTKYTTTSNRVGAYDFLNIRIGGPYKLVASSVGYRQFEQMDIFAPLGTTSNVDFKMDFNTSSLENIVITGERNSIINSKSNGTSVTIGRQAINATPTIGRNVNDVTKYNAYSNGRSFAGQDSRFNNFTIDGAVFNNGFGLGSDAQAGGRTNSTAISLDALDELQINITPYDIRQSGFAGAAINAVTRSGNNDFSGSVFRFWNNRDLAGTKAASKIDNIPVTPFSV